VLKRVGESTAAGAILHESSYPEPEGRRIEGGEVRDGLAQGSSVCIRLLCGARHSARYLLLGRDCFRGPTAALPECSCGNTHSYELRNRDATD
jgi:hypothetical protein